MIDSLKILREKTKVSMSECKRVLVLCDGDADQAAQILLNTGRVKKLDTPLDAREGIVRAHVDLTGIGRIIELNCQTDFAARSGVFDNFVNDVLNSMLVFHDLPIGLFDSSVVTQLNEQISCKRKQEISTNFSDRHVWYYNHHNNKISVLIEYSINKIDESKIKSWKEITDIIENIGMQIAANKPLVVHVQDLSQDLIDKQRSIFENQLREDPKLAQACQNWPKIIDGKFKKWYSDIVLMNQESILFPKKTVEQILIEQSKALDDNLKIVLIRFIRWELGEQI